MTIIALDTEYDSITKRPFIATISDGINAHLYYLNNPKDYFIVKQLAESKKITKIFHSATSDIYALAQINIQVSRPYHDTFIMSSIIDENFSTRKLKGLAQKYLEEPCLEQKELNKVKTVYKKKYGKNFSWEMIPKEIIAPYAIKDAEYTYKLYQYFKPKIKPFYDLYRLELALVPIIVSMSLRGHQIDRSFCYYELKMLENLSDYYYNKVIKYYGKIVSLQSPMVIRRIIKKENITITEKTKTGLISTNKSILEPLAPKYEVISDILNYRNAIKQIQTYYTPLLNNYTNENNFIAHFQFYQSGTKTGRFSAELIQTIPKEQTAKTIKNRVRQAFIARQGYINLYFDYEQIEMRLFAHFTQNQVLLDAIKGGFDAHEGTAKDLFGEEKYNLDPKKYRKMAKTINFGMIYGMGSNLLAQTLGLSLVEATEILYAYNRKYKIKEFMNKMSETLYRQGYIKLDWINREYRVPKDMSYKCVNVLIQGSAAYLLKLAMLRVAKYLKNFPDMHMLLQIHDELVIEVPQNAPIKGIAQNIKEQMEDQTTFSVPITVSVEYSIKSWLNKQPFDLEKEIIK